MPGTGLSSKRIAVGLCALLCLLMAAGLWLFTGNPEANQFLSALTRVGIVLAALWLALPEARQSIVWQKAGPILLAAAIVVAVMPKLVRYALPAAVVLSIAAILVRPKPKRTRTP